MTYAKQKKYWKTHDGHVFMVIKGELTDVTKQYKAVRKRIKEKYPNLMLATMAFENKFNKEFYAEVKHNGTDN